MKLITFFLFFLTSHYLNGQSEKVIYFDKYWNTVSSKSEYEYSRLVLLNKQGKPTGEVRDYYKDGNIQMEGWILSDNLGCFTPEGCLLDGLCTFYKEDGKVNFSGIYSSGVLVEVLQDNRPENTSKSLNEAAQSPKTPSVTNDTDKNTLKQDKSKSIINFRLSNNLMKQHYFKMLRLGIDINSIDWSSPESTKLILKLKNDLRSSANSLGLIHSVKNGVYVANVNYENSKTPTRSNYVLEVEVTNNYVTKIDFEQGSVHTGRNSSGYSYEGGELYFEYDEYGNLTGGSTLVIIQTRTYTVYYEVKIPIQVRNFKN